MVKTVQETHLYKWLYEKNSAFLGQVDEAIQYAETMLPLISKVFTDYTVHGKRYREHIENQMDEKLFRIPNSSVVSFRDELGLICMSHNEDFEWIEKELSSQSKKGHFEINSQYISVLLRISDYLDIDEQRAPLYLYKYLQPKEFGNLEWKQHFVIENFDKVVMNEKTGLKEIIFQGTSQEPSVHRKLNRIYI